MMKTSALLLSISLLMILNSTATAETLVWNFSIDEQSIRNGPEADGSTNSPGFGEGTVALDVDTHVISYDLAWSGLIGDLTKLHIHGPASADQSNPQHLIEIFGPPEIPTELVATAGSVSSSFTLQTLEQTGFAALSPETIIETMVNGQAYLNVHTTVFGMGEIRGNLGQPVPEPNALLLCGFGVLCLVAARRRRTR